MRTFVIQMNHELVPFELNNTTAIRMDLVARCVNSALWLDHDLRRDVIIYFCFSNGITVRLDGSIRGMNPDERNVASFFRHLLDGRKFPGMELSECSFEELVSEFDKKKVFVLDSNGKPFDKAKLPEDPVFVLGDDVGITQKVSGNKVTIGPKSYLTSHCIVILNNFMDRKILWE